MTFASLFPSPLYDPYYFSIHSKTVHIKVIDDEEYEKTKNFFIELMSPRMVDMSLQKGVVLALQTNINVLSSSLPSPSSSSLPLMSLCLQLLCPKHCCAHTVSHGTHGVAWGVVLGLLRGKVVRGEEREGWRAVLLVHISGGDLRGTFCHPHWRAQANFVASVGRCWLEMHPASQEIIAQPWSCGLFQSNSCWKITGMEAWQRGSSVTSEKQ